MNTSAAQNKGVVVYKRLFAYAWRYSPMFITAVIGMAVYGLSEAGMARMMKPLMDGAFIQRDAEMVVDIPLFIISLFLIRGLAGFLSGYCIGWIGRKVIAELRQEVFEKFLYLPTAYYDHHSAGTMLSKLTYNIEQVANTTTTVARTMIEDSLKVIFFVALMLWVDWFLTLFVLVMGPAIGWLMRYLSFKFRAYSLSIQNSMGDVTHITKQALESSKVVKVFNGQEYEKKQFGKVNEHNRRMNMKLVFTKAASVPVIQILAGIGIASVIYVATNTYLTPGAKNVLTPGDFGVFLGAMLFMMAPLKKLTNVNSQLQAGIAAGQSIFELLDEDNENEGGARIFEGRADGHVAYQGLSFSYSDKKGAVLNDITLEIPAGQTLAIVGRSGSGKSTLISLLPRFYDASEGSILLDGHDIRDYEIGSLREQISLVSQEVILFDDTIRNNISYGGLGEHSENEIEKAADAAHVSEFAQSLPDRLDTLVGERGLLLSGGQRQRIAIARALLKNAPILILDEATSALDTESERHIQRALDQLMQNRTTLVIAHRLSTVENADRIVVLDKGRMVEFGTHHELMKNNGHYAALHRMQFHEPDSD